MKILISLIQDRRFKRIFYFAGTNIKMMRTFLFFILFQIGLFDVTAQNIIIQPYLQDVKPQSTRIMWETDAEGKGFVDWGTSPFNLFNTEESAVQIGSGNSRIHTATLPGLLPGSKYYYQVRSATGQTSYVYHFKTIKFGEDEQSVQLIAISDMQRDGNNPDVFREIVEDGIIPIIQSEIDSPLTSLEGILIPGDLVATGGNYDSWRTSFFLPSDSLTPYVPLYPVPGNHEYFGGGLPNFLKYFALPENGPPNLNKQAWYKDISNIRIIGLNSNSGGADQDSQLVWLQELLDSSCIADHVDFVFAQLHHPYKSELWLPGESNFTGEVVALLEVFTEVCGKASIHFFGHTHGYSRGQSRDHKHLWVNVATAGGNIDYWGEFANADYDEFSISQDEYGFVLISSEAGDDPSFTLKRFTRGDEFVQKNNELVDQITIKNQSYPPETPIAIFPSNDSIGDHCLILKSSAFNDPGIIHQATQWQVATGCDFVDSLVHDSWKQNSNWYNETDLQAGDDLTDLAISGLETENTYCWRARYRNEYLTWSDWSPPVTFYLKSAGTELTGNIIVNGGAEDGITGWTGDIESLLSNECNSVPAFAGQSLFAVGGICANEISVGIAYQEYDVNAFSGLIDADSVSLLFGSYMRNYSGSDIPEIYAEFYNHLDQLIHSSPHISNATPVWIKKNHAETIPPGSRKVRIVLKGIRNSGTDNDSYFDDVFAQLIRVGTCHDCYTYTEGSIDEDLDGFCADLDCNDMDTTIYPGALELCDLKDNDCDGKVDAQIAIWTGLGDGVLWGDGENWNQGFSPLPCQHVTINTADSISITQNPTVQSLDLGILSTLGIQPSATLTVLGDTLQNIATVSIKGKVTNKGKCHFFPTAEDTLMVEGLLSNEGSILIHGAGNREIAVKTGGTIMNRSLLDLIPD